MWFSSPLHFSGFGDCQVALQFLVLETGINKSERFLLESRRRLWNHGISDCRDHLAQTPSFTEEESEACEVTELFSHRQARPGELNHKDFTRLRCSVSHRVFGWKVGSLYCTCVETKRPSLSGQILWALVVGSWRKFQWYYWGVVGTFHVYSLCYGLDLDRPML